MNEMEPRTTISKSAIGKGLPMKLYAENLHETIALPPHHSFVPLSLAAWPSTVFAIDTITSLRATAEPLARNRLCACLTQGHGRTYTHDVITDKCTITSLYPFEPVYPFYVRPCARPFASNFFNSRCAFPDSVLGNHVSFQRSLHSVPPLVSLLSRIFITSHSYFSTSARPPWPWGCSGAKVLIAVALAEPTVADVLLLWSSASRTGCVWDIRHRFTFG